MRSHKVVTKLAVCGGT